MATVITTITRQYYKCNRTEVSGTARQLHGLGVEWDVGTVKRVGGLQIAIAYLNLKHIRFQEAVVYVLDLDNRHNRLLTGKLTSYPTLCV